MIGGAFVVPLARRQRRVMATRTPGKQALKQVAGASLKTILAQMTDNRFLGLAAGASITAIIQSSSITTVLLVGFISAGLLTTAQSVAVIIGANIGTTITAQILAFKVTAFTLPVLSLGFFVSLIAKRKVHREYGRILLGLGMVFAATARRRPASP